MARDYYQLLEVSRNASKEEIRKAFRVKAKEIHPDHNPDDPRADARFITLKKAHDLLVDPVRRQKYDRDLLRSNNNNSRGNRRNAGKARSAGAKRGSRNETRAAPKPRRGLDIERTVRLSLEQIWKGSTRTVHGHRIHIRGIPANSRIRYPGKGGTGENGGPGGDLHVIVEVLRHKRYTRDGDDLRIDLSLDSEFAQRGGAKVVDTLSGKVRLTIKRGSETGQVYRIRGKGLPSYGKDNEFGDLYVQITVDRPAPVRGNNLERHLLITLQEAWRGGEYQLSHRGASFNVTIPRGVRSEQRVPIVGEGEPGKNGGPPGDLYINFTVLSDERFRRDGDDLYLNEDMAINLNTALKGGNVEIATPSGKTLLNVPPGTQFGQSLSLSGHGMPRRDRSGTFGNLYTRVRIQVPDAEEWEVDRRYNSWYWPARRQADGNSLYLKIQYKEGGYDWAVLVNNSRLEYRGRDPRYCGKCYPTSDNRQAKLDAAARARAEAAIGLLRRAREEQIPVDVSEIPF